MGLLEKSLRENGAGRSILVDKDDNIIAGNGIVEAAINAGIKKTRVVEVTGDELVVVKRTDLELDSKKGRKMALADNATAAADLAWNEENIAVETDKWDIVPEDWGVKIDVPSPDEFGDQFTLPDGEKGLAQMTLESNGTRPRPELGGKSYYEVTGGKYDFLRYVNIVGGGN